MKNEGKRDEAVEKFENVSNVTTKTVWKLKPNIMICNVHGEEDKEKNIENLIERND